MPAISAQAVCVANSTGPPDTTLNPELDADHDPQDDIPGLDPDCPCPCCRSPVCFLRGPLQHLQQLRVRPVLLCPGPGLLFPVPGSSPSIDTCT